MHVELVRMKTRDGLCVHPRTGPLLHRVEWWGLGGRVRMAEGRRRV